MVRNYTWRSTVGVLLLVAGTITGMWWGFEPPLWTGMIASLVVTVFLVGWHQVLVRYLQPPGLVLAEEFGTVEVSKIRAELEHLINDDRYALLLRPQLAGELPPDLFAGARRRLEFAAALVPGGNVEQGPRVLSRDFDGTPPSLVHVPSFWIDRHTITNQQFQRFVAAGGYAQASLWEPAAWTLLARFVDRTGRPAPAFWREANYLPGTEHHPVVGVSWYEALAYARWAGKHLPTDAQWLKVAGWPIALEQNQAGATHLTQHRYPWGQQFEPARANLRPGGSGQVVAVDQYSAGSNSHGVQQLLGNVWEWTSDEFEHLPSEIRACRALSLAGQLSAALKITRGGAYDTDLDGQSTADLIHAECPLTRAANIGFRCALAWSDILPASALPGFQPPPAASWLLSGTLPQFRVEREITATRAREQTYLRNCYDERDGSLECAAGSSESVPRSARVE